MKRYLPYLAAIVVLLALVAGVLLFAHLRPLPVEITQPQQNVPIQVYGLGTVEARVVSNVGFEIGNTLVELHVDHGDRVAEGQVLARLHQSEQRAQVAKAAAAVAQARADLEKAYAHVERAEAVLAQKRQINRRKQELVRRNVVSIETAEEAQTDVEVAVAELAVARSEVAVTEAALANAKAQHQLEEVMLVHHTLTAPYDAIVVERHQELGTVLAPGERVFTLVDPNTVWVLIYVDEARAGGLQIGQPAEIRLRSLPHKTFSGQIARIGIESDRVSEERRVYIAFEHIPADFHLHEQAEALIATAHLERAVLVPQTAVEKFDGTTGTVWTVEEGRLARRAVRFDRQTLDGRLEIVEGLPIDALVVTEWVSGLREGRSVIVDEGAEA